MITKLVSFIYVFPPFLGVDRWCLLVPRLCPDCAKERGFNSKRIKHEVNVYLLEAGLSFLICSACGRQVTVSGGARRLMGLLEASSLRSMMRTKIRYYKKGGIG